MDELSTHELRGAAAADSLRRAFGTPVEGELPQPFAVLLNRLSQVQPSFSPQRDEQPRLGV
ncbi:hypothetical protein FHG66_01035 [Rubellimicrobium rubrum]|uniref:Uncharacterized protein n=1 Tax=Rubellimicrobium rubrum TaxID=2585369 RepID=A0A5C4N8D0_9RHOB|nr:hypothetical protein [Rubellimicrobium rubrum]TNC52910.1 hypothetical protein FHG66_01035 [Rubellimicrobium rubrum]